LVKRNETARRAFLDTTAADIGRGLFAAWRDALLLEGRTISGGWPGTLREARSAVVATLGGVLSRNSMAAATDEELGLVVHAAYAEARRAWMRSVDRRQELEF
jgi:hypothetical protein